MNQEKIGKFIAERRKEKNLTQQDLADKLRLTSKAVSKWECGKGLPDVSLYEELCDILGISLNEFFAGEYIDKKDIQEQSEKNILDILETNNKKNKKIKIIIITVICFAILLCATTFSISKFYVWNPFSSCFGMLEILFTDKEYTVVQNKPFKVIFVKTSKNGNKVAGQILDEYMESRGFYFVPEEQLGAELVYSNGTEKEHIYFSGNGYYYIGKWD